MTPKTASFISIALGAAAALSSTATAATVTNIDTTIINAGTCAQTTGCAESYSIVTQGNSTVSLSGASASSFGFVDSFNQGSGVLNVNTGSNFGPAATGSGAPWNFQDNILFTTSGGIVQVQASATLTNVTNLQLRIISANSAQNTPLDIFTSTSANAAGLLGASVVNIVDGWTNFSNPVLGVDYTGVLPTSLAPGSYIIQIRGEAAAGSSYSGTATFTPVPLPAGVWLLMSGILAAAGFARPRASIPAPLRA